MTKCESCYETGVFWTCKWWFKYAVCIPHPWYSCELKKRPWYISVCTVLVEYRYSAVPLQRSQLSPRSSQNTPHSSPVRARYWMHFMGINCDLFSTSDAAVMYAISCYIEPRYKALDCILISAMGGGGEIVLLLYARSKWWFLTSCFLCVGLLAKCPVTVKEYGWNIN